MIKKYIFITFILCSINLFSSCELEISVLNSAAFILNWKTFSINQAKCLWDSLNYDQQLVLLKGLLKRYQDDLKVGFQQHPFAVLFANYAGCLHNLQNIEVTFNQPIWQTEIIIKTLKMIFEQSFSKEEFAMLMNVRDNCPDYFAKLKQYANDRNLLLKDIARTQDLIEILQRILIKEGNLENQLPALCTGDTLFSKSLKTWILEREEKMLGTSAYRDLVHS